MQLVKNEVMLGTGGPKPNPCPYEKRGVGTQTEWHVKTEAEVGDLLPQATPKIAGCQQQQEEAGRMHPLSLWREHSPAHTLTPYDGLCDCERIHGRCLKPQFVVMCYMPWKK